VCAEFLVFELQRRGAHVIGAVTAGLDAGYSTRRHWVLITSKRSNPYGKGVAVSQLGGPDYDIKEDYPHNIAMVTIFQSTSTSRGEGSGLLGMDEQRSGRRYTLKRCVGA
jgi:hypothetical protein